MCAALIIHVIMRTLYYPGILQVKLFQPSFYTANKWRLSFGLQSVIFERLLLTVFRDFLLFSKR